MKGIVQRKKSHASALTDILLYLLIVSSLSSSPVLMPHSQDSEERMCVYEHFCLCFGVCVHVGV